MSAAGLFVLTNHGIDGKRADGPGTEGRSESGETCLRRTQSDYVGRSIDKRRRLRCQELHDSQVAEKEMLNIFENRHSRLLLLGLTLILLGVLAVALKKIRKETSLDAFVPADSPA